MEKFQMSAHEFLSRFSSREITELMAYMALEAAELRAARGK